MWKELFHEDYYRMIGKEWSISGYIYMLIYHNIRFMYWFRKYQSRPSLYRRFKLYRFSRKYGIEVATTASMGGGVYLGHPYNITIGDKVVLGRNVNLHKGCTIGRENRGSRMGAPKIGDNVYIGINATVVGNVNIGNDVLIAANSFVNYDVPSNSIVLGNPGKVIPRKQATAGYVNFCIAEEI